MPPRMIEVNDGYAVMPKPPRPAAPRPVTPRPAQPAPRQPTTPPSPPIDDTPPIPTSQSKPKPSAPQLSAAPAPKPSSVRSREYEDGTPKVPGVPAFNFNEFWGDDFDPATLGEGVAAVFVRFLDLVIPGTWDDEQSATAYQVVRGLMTLASGRNLGIGRRVDASESSMRLHENMSASTLAWIEGNLSDAATDRFISDSEHELAQELIGELQWIAGYYYPGRIDLGDIEDLSAQDVLASFVSELERLYNLDVEDGVENEEFGTQYRYWNELLQTFGPMPYQDLEALLRTFQLSGYPSEESVRNHIMGQLGRMNDEFLSPEWHSQSTLQLAQEWHLEVQNIIDRGYLLPSEAQQGQMIYNDYVAALQQLEGTYHPTDLTLLKLVFSILVEPYDWVMTGIEIVQDVQKGDLIGAGANLILAGLPFIGGWADDVSGVYRAADDVGTGGGSWLDDAAQAAGRSVDDSQYNPRRYYVPDDESQPARNRAIRSNARTLRQSLQAANNANPSSWEFRVPRQFEAAHHIVPSISGEAADARAILRANSIQVNSAYNGVGLSLNIHGLEQRDVLHVTYAQAVNEAILTLAGSVPPETLRGEIIELLDEIAVQLDGLQQYSGVELDEAWVAFIQWLDSRGGVR